MDKVGKRKFVGDLNAVFKRAGCVVVAHYTGVTVAQMESLRSKMREAGGIVKIAKNRLAKIAVRDTDSENILDLFKGQSLIACSEDPIAAARVVCSFAKENERFSIIGGAMGSKVLDVESIKSLAALPSLNELRARILGIVVAPASRIACVVNAPANCLARVVGAYARKGNEA